MLYRERTLEDWVGGGSNLSALLYLHVVLLISMVLIALMPAFEEKMPLVAEVVSIRPGSSACTVGDSLSAKTIETGGDRFAVAQGRGGRRGLLEWRHAGGPPPAEGEGAATNAG